MAHSLSRSSDEEDPWQWKPGTAQKVEFKHYLTWEFWFSKSWKCFFTWLGFIAAVSFIILVALYHLRIVHFIRPAIQWMHDIGWYGALIPVGILVIISIPPLFGHEVVGLLCGLVWGVWIGFGIVAVGTLFGEILLYCLCKYTRLKRIMQKKLKPDPFARCLAYNVYHEGPWKTICLAILVRFSVIPGHLTTPLFAICGMKFWPFFFTAFISLIKQFLTVYIGTKLDSGDSSTGQDSTSSNAGTDKTMRIVSDVVLGVTVLISLLAILYIAYVIRVAAREINKNVTTDVNMSTISSANGPSRGRNRSTSSSLNSRSSTPNSAPYSHDSSLSRSPR